MSVLAILVMLVTAYTATAQSVGETEQGEQSEGVFRQQKRYNIFFKINRPEIDSTFQKNGETLRQMREDLETTLQVDGVLPDSLLILSTASPDGSYKFNKWLAAERAKSTEKLLLDMFPQFKEATILVDYLEEDWDGLMQVLKDDENFPQREEMIRIIQGKADVDNKEKALRACREGWRYLVRNHIYSLRNSSITICVVGKPDIYTRSEPVPPVKACSYKPEFTAPEKGINPQPYFERPVWKKMIMQARTNLLIPGMNVGLEFPIGNNWSVGIDYYYPWFVSKGNKWCTEMLGWFVDGKYWFTTDKYKWTPTEKLQGHAVGVYAGLGYYDFQNIAKGAQGEYVDFGVDYTFGLPLADGKLRLEFNIGLGCIITYYRNYNPSTDFSDLIKEPGVKMRSTNFFGPTRASVNLAVPIRARTRKPQVSNN